MKKLLFIFLLFPSILFSQSETTNGINFLQGLNWAQIQAKAKVENKYIFVDCFATWCRPCLAMDKEIYGLQKVGNVINKNFLSVKVQLDSSKGDNDKVCKWYKDAHLLMTKYQINAFPTFLFFSPNGDLVHKGVGFKNEQDFIALVSDAINPKKQYFKLLAEYRKGIWDTISLKQLARLTRDFGDKELAGKMAETYITGQTYEGLLKKENIQFMVEFIRNSNQKAFSVFYNNKDTINKIMNDDDYSQSVVSFVITKEEIAPKISNLPQDKQPMWDELEQSIARKYDQYYALRAVTRAQMIWYKGQKKWTDYVKSLSEEIDRKYKNKDLDNFWIGVALNNDCMELVRYAMDTSILNGGILWMEKLFRANIKNATDADYIDTYANLIYKKGDIDEALFWENKAVLLSGNSEQYLEIYKKMQRKLSTWTEQKN
jgi:thioredoxin-related protein